MGVSTRRREPAPHRLLSHLPKGRWGCDVNVRNASTVSSSSRHPHSSPDVAVTNTEESRVPQSSSTTENTLWCIPLSSASGKSPRVCVLVVMSWLHRSKVDMAVSTWQMDHPSHSPILHAMFAKNVCVLSVIITHGPPTLKTRPCHTQLFTVHVSLVVVVMTYQYDCF